MDPEGLDKDHNNKQNFQKENIENSSDEQQNNIMVFENEDYCKN